MNVKLYNSAKRLSKNIREKTSKAFVLAHEDTLEVVVTSGSSLKEADVPDSWEGYTVKVIHEDVLPVRV